MIKIQVDDFYTNGDTVGALKKTIDKIAQDIELFLFVLLGWSSPKIIREMRHVTDTISCIGLHGFNHLAEPSLGYWQARHVLETATSWNCLDRIFVMPWNRMPKLGFFRALKEAEYTLATPYRSQRLLASILRVNSIDIMPDILLHPPDFLSERQRIETIERIQKLRENDHEVPDM